MQKIKYIQKEQGRVEGEEIDFKAKIHTIKMNFKKLNYLIKGLFFLYKQSSIRRQHWVPTNSNSESS